jgi:hypothetical protein
MNHLKHLLAASLTLTACNASTEVVGSLQEEVAMMRSLPNRDLDLLFVIDDSGSTGDKQAAFAAAFPSMIDVLSQIDGGLPNLHIGVITSDMGVSTSSGALGPDVSGQGGCTRRGKDGRLQSVNTPEPYLSDVEGPNGTRVRNYAGALRDAFTANASQGYDGCGFEQPLAAMKRAFENPKNAGFLRPNANLAVIFLTDEDDCSAKSTELFSPDERPDEHLLGTLQSFRCFRWGVTCDQSTDEAGTKTGCTTATDSPYVEDIAPFVEALLATKSDERMVMTAAIMGDPAPVAVELRSPHPGFPAIPALAHSCAYNTSSGPAFADPGVRMAEFLAAFPDRNAQASVCDADLTTPLAFIAESAKKLMGDPCLDTTRLADASAADPGVQPSCEVSEVRDSAPDAPALLPLCTSGGSDCFELVADVDACPATTDHLRVRIHRSTAPHADAWTHVRCQLAR